MTQRASVSTQALSCHVCYNRKRVPCFVFEPVSRALAQSLQISSGDNIFNLEDNQGLIADRVSLGPLLSGQPAGWSEFSFSSAEVLGSPWESQYCASQEGGSAWGRVAASLCLGQPVQAASGLPT